MPRRVVWFSILAVSVLCGCSQPPGESSVPESGSGVASAPDGAAVDGDAVAEVKPAAAPASAQPASEPGTLPLKSEPVLLLSEQERTDGWIQLFDGQTLAGWEPGDEIDWHVTEDGVIEASQGGPGLLLTTVPFSDYELRCDWWLEKDGNSGIFLRTLAAPQVVTADCYELNMCDSHPEFKTASLVGRAQPVREVTGEEVWKTFHVRVEGPRITVNLDGQEVLDHTDTTPGLRLNGLIGLQKNKGLVRFRNVFLRPLGTRPLLNGSDLSGWHPVPGSRAEFAYSEDEQAVSVKGGQGFLETDDAWADFVLQFDTRINTVGLNSGLFFRLKPGTQAAPSHGYELQLENVFLNGDRRQPKDNAGTGAIFRRTQARWVVPDDRQWFTTTLVASGDRLAVWVDGFQVTDWQDTREPDSNPRVGRRLEAGPISLQGHDPTTDVSFRNLRIAPLPDASPATAAE